MGELFKALRHFVTRDLVFVLSGSIELAAALYYLDWLPTKETPTAFHFFGLGVAYVLGFITHGIARVLGIVRSTSPRSLPPLARWLYRRYKNKSWTDISADTKFLEVRDDITNERIQAEFDRIVTMKLIGTAVGPACLVSSAILIARRLRIHSDERDLLVGVATAIAGMLLIAIGWIKVAEQATYLSELNDRVIRPSNQTLDQRSRSGRSQVKS